MNTQAFNIVLPVDLVKKIDTAADREYKNRSELIREVLRLYLKDQEEWEELFAYGTNKGKKLGIKNEKEIERIVQNFRKGK